MGYFGLVFFLCWIVNLILGVIPNWIMTQLEFSDGFRAYLGSTLTYGLRLAAVIVLSAWALRKTVGGNPRELLLPGRDWWKNLLFGFSVTFTMVLLIFMAEYFLGWLDIEGWKWQDISSDAYLQNIWLAILINIYVAVSEEMMFRGYLLSGLKKAWGTPYALLMMAVIFAALHLTVTGADETFPALFVLLLTIPGIILGWAFLQSRSLWLPIGIHFTWNLMQDEVLNLHGRGAVNLIGAMTVQHGPEWIVGTNYGVETGLIGILAMTLIGSTTWLWTQRKREEAETQ